MAFQFNLRFSSSPAIGVTAIGAGVRRTLRRGAAVVEGAIVLGVLLVLLLAILDLGLAAARYNILAATARQVAREAIVRGSLATPEATSWGPATFSAAASDGSEIATAARESLAALPPSDVAVTVEWPDGGNREGDRVDVELRYFHDALPILGVGTGFDLRARSSMRIVH